MLHFKGIWILYFPCSRTGQKIDNTGTTSGGKLPCVKAQVSLCDQTHCWGNKELGKVVFIWVLTSQIWPLKCSYPSSSPFGHCWAVFMANRTAEYVFIFNPLAACLEQVFFTGILGLPVEEHSVILTLSAWEQLPQGELLQVFVKAAAWMASRIMTLY